MRKELFEEKEYFKIECYEELDGLLNTKDVWFYGAGTICKKIIKTRKSCKKPVCSGILQSNTSDNKELFGIKIYQYEKSQDKDKVVLVITTVYSCEIAKQLAVRSKSHFGRSRSVCTEIVS